MKTKPKTALVFFPLWVLVAIAFSPSCHQTKNNDENQVADHSDSSGFLTGFEKADSVNPVLTPGADTFRDPVTNRTVAWEAKNVFNPAAVVRAGKIYLLYRAQDSTGGVSGTSRIGLATSTDGLHFTRLRHPVLYPDNDSYRKYEWPGGCEDPRVVQDSAGTYYMTYTAYDGKTARLFVATSEDLVHWTKQGGAFSDAGQGKYADAWSKSGAIVSRYQNGTPVAVKIQGKYWMYWGDKFIWAATSDDLIHWKPVEKLPGEKDPVALRGEALKVPDLKIVIPTRRGKFDYDLVESGPPAMVTTDGILLIYNARNVRQGGDSTLAEGAYCGGQVLLDKDDPTRIVHRMDNEFIRPDKPYEITGEVNNVCFLEGLVRLKQQWFLYYGTADRNIAVAVSGRR